MSILHQGSRICIGHIAHQTAVFLYAFKAQSISLKHQLGQGRAGPANFAGHNALVLKVGYRVNLALPGNRHLEYAGIQRHQVTHIVVFLFEFSPALITIECGMRVSPAQVGLSGANRLTVRQPSARCIGGANVNIFLHYGHHGRAQRVPGTSLRA